MMGSQPRTFIQFPPAAGPLRSDIDYRQGFFDWVQHHGISDGDLVLIYTLDAQEVCELETLWRKCARVEVRVAYPSLRAVDTEVRPIFVATTPEGRVTAANEFDAQRWAPSYEIATLKIRSENVPEKLTEMQSQGICEICICADFRDPEQRAVTSLKQQISAICFVSADVPQPVITRALKALTSDGLRLAGRPFGEAKTSYLLIRPTHPRAAIEAVLAQARIRVGLIIERLQGFLGPRGRSKTRSVLFGGSRYSFLGEDIGFELPPVTRSQVAHVFESVRAHPIGSWSVAIDAEQDPHEVARACHNEFGLWPISFNYPDSRPLKEPVNQLSPIIPGYSYSFMDNDAYVEMYARSSMALTFRKAGWDCFRHVEILGSGVVPLMPDAHLIPRFSMIHYPKIAMMRAAEIAVVRGGTPDKGTQQAFRDYFMRHLTSLAMAKYMLDVSGLAGSENVLFIDEQTLINPEYQSTLALIGLKQLLGKSCKPAFPAGFLYRDCKDSTTHFYGRGFGYTHVLDPTLRSQTEFESQPGYGLDRMKSFDAIVVGSTSRNIELTQRVIETCDPSRVILIHGEDGPPSEAEARYLRDSGAHVFVRAIHA